VDAQHADVYRSNLHGLLEDLNQVHDKIARELAPFKGQEFFVFHPAFGYFAQRYGLKQMPVEIEGKQPTAKQLAQLIDKARKTGVRTIFVQPQFSRTGAERLAKATGATVVPMDPLAKDYLKNLEDMGTALAKGLQNQTRK
jgi:zinc transport system substrate-binding protein